MTLYYVNTGSGPNSQDGDSLRTAFNKINANFSQINTGSLGAVLVQSPSVPQGYGPNTLWYDTESGRTFIFYNGAWIDANPSSNQNQSTVTVGLYDPESNLSSNTVTNVSKINFDVLADFSVTDQGSGNVLVGMNSTFKYIKIAGQQTLTAQGVDTLNLVAGTGTQLITSYAGIKNLQTITFISTGSGSGTATFPGTTSSGYLYNDGDNNIEWRTVSLNTLTNGAAKFTLNSNGSITFNNNTIQTTAFVSPATDSTNYSHYVFFRGNTGVIQYNTNLYYNPSTRELGNISKLNFSDNTVQTTSWLGFTSTLHSSVSAPRASLTLSTTTLRLSTGTITFPDLTVQRTAFTGTVDWSNIANIPVTTTSSLRNNGFVANLSEFGEVTVPKIFNVQHLGNTVFSIIPKETGGVLSAVDTTTNLTIQTTSTERTYSWIFNNDGTITFPDNTIQTSAGRNVYSSIFSGTQYLSIGSNGVVTFPDGSGQTTAFKGTATSLENSGYRLRPVAVPANVNFGAPNDRVGDIAFDQSFLYYCFASYGSKTFTTGTFNSGTNVNFIQITQNSTNFAVPQAGWTFQQVGSSTVYTLTSPAQSLSIGFNRVFVLTSSTALLNYSSGTVFTVTNTVSKQANWIKTAVTNAGLVTKFSSFVAQGEPVTNGVIRVQWESEIVFNQNTSKLTFSAVSGKISNVVYNLTSHFGGAASIQSGNIAELTATLYPVGPTSISAGDNSTLIISSVDSNFCYRVTALTGNNFENNFISIEQLL